jgi:DNA-binding CsgD family transcriptional regulator
MQISAFSVDLPSCRGHAKSPAPVRINAPQHRLPTRDSPELQKESPMPHTNIQACPHVEKLMDIAATLADYTQSAELAGQVPGYLAQMLEIEPLTLAVVAHNNATGRSELAMLATSGPIPTGDATFASHVLDIHQQTRSNDAVLRSPFAVDGASERNYAEVAVANFTAFPKALVFARTIDEHYRLCLIIHQRGGQTAPSTTQTDSLIMVAGLLAKLLGCMLAWQDRPEILGSEFERLTDREWVVLRGLNSDDGEKQLADRLSLSPHTLHSHIKSIYRKVGVQGRLPLLQRLSTSIRELRRLQINTPARVQAKNFAAAAG